MLSHMRIDAGLPADAAEIAAIEQLPEYRSYIGSWSTDEHRRMMANSDNEYFVARDDSDAVEGFAILQGVQSEHHNLHLKRIAVRAPNRGLGRALLEHVMARAFEYHGAHRFWLDVFDTNTRARHLYAACGFREEGTMRESILRDGEYHTLVLMSLLDREYAEYTKRQQKAAESITG
jgi:diamine N-acetyltransferase